jgi:hypothetical protein
MKQHSENNEKEDISEYQPKDWVFEVLDLAKTAEPVEPPISQAFMERCAEASKVALNFAKLREARRRVGFVPLPATDYIRQLIKQVGIPEASILSWLGREDFSLAEQRESSTLRDSRKGSESVCERLWSICASVSLHRWDRLRFRFSLRGPGPLLTLSRSKAPKRYFRRSSLDTTLLTCESFGRWSSNSQLRMTKPALMSRSNQPN